MDAVHLVVGLTVLAANIAAGGWGAWAWVRHEPAVGFWYVLRFAQVAVVGQVMIGAVLLLLGRAAADLHYLYGVLPILVSLTAEAIRSGAADRELEGLDFDSLPKARQGAIALAIVRRETGIMAVSALIIVFLALRAAASTPFL
ncbi:MAG: hypothetical protein ACR2G3_09505 [Solirubrobacterales bacterium]